MPTTVLGLFRNPHAVDQAVREIEALGFARNEVQRVEEPDSFEVTGVMSFPRLDFESELDRSLKKIGVADTEAEAVREGLRNGATLVFATDNDPDKVRRAAAVLNRYCATDISEGEGSRPEAPRVEYESRKSPQQTFDLAGRVAQGPQPATHYFSW